MVRLVSSFIPTNKVDLWHTDDFTDARFIDKYKSFQSAHSALFHLLMYGSMAPFYIIHVCEGSADKSRTIYECIQCTIPWKCMRRKENTLTPRLNHEQCGEQVFTIQFHSPRTVFVACSSWLVARCWYDRYSYTVQSYAPGTLPSRFKAI